MRKYIFVLCAVFLSFASLYAKDGTAPKREFRGAWIHIVGNKKIAALTTDEAKQMFLDVIDSCYLAGCNAIIFQVRPTADAFYESDIEPWTRYLTGVQGKAPDPYWDPLQFAIEESHKRGMELHAWCNPYRVTLEQTDTLCGDHLYFKNRGIDLSTQYAFHRHFCLATKYDAEETIHTCLAFPLTLPKGDGTVVGFEERDCVRIDGSSNYQDKAEEGNTNEGLWIVSPAQTPLAEAKHVYWFESAYDAMAYYQLHQAQNQELQKAVFVSTGGKPIEKQTRDVLELTIPATQHICFNNNRKGWNFKRELQQEICRTVHSAIEETPERKPYLDSIGDGHDLDEGELELLPKSVQESYIRFEAEQDKFMLMRWDEQCVPENIKKQAGITGKCYREYREKLQEFLGIDKEHDVAITHKEPDYRYTSWNDQLLAERKLEEASEKEQAREEEPEQERQTRFHR